MNAPSHPSYLALDRLAAGEPNAEVEAHAKECERCHGHLARLREAPAPATPSVPRNRRRPRWPVPMGLAVAAAVVLVVVVWPEAGRDTTRGDAQQASSGATVRTKGPPRHVLWIKRGPRVFPWQPGTPVSAGDRLRLEVAGSGYTHLAVAVPADGGWEVLYRDTLPPEGALLLDAGWEVDATGATESLLVAFTRDPLPDAQVARLAREPRRDPQVWTVRLDLPKEPR